MFDDKRLAHDEPENKRRKSGTCHVNHIVRADQPAQLRKLRLAQNLKRELAIIKIPGRCLGYKRNFEFREARRSAKLREATGN
jgi:hypothetical protein